MKTAEEWLKEEASLYEINGKLGGYVEHSAEAMLTIYKAIQLDAWKQGYKEGYEDAKSNRDSKIVE